MGDLLNGPLPAWADNAEARGLLVAIADNPPRAYVRSANDFGPATERFQGASSKPLCQLRKLYDAWYEREIHALQVQYDVHGKWDEEASRAIHKTLDADEVVRRMLDGEQLTEVASGPLQQEAA